MYKTALPYTTACTEQFW